VPFGSNRGPIDGLCRIDADQLQQRWGRAIIVAPRPGASGVIAACDGLHLAPSTEARHGARTRLAYAPSAVPMPDDAAAAARG